LLYLSVLLSQFIIGILFTHLPKKRRTDREIPVGSASSHNTPPLGRLFTDAVSASSSAILLVCAYVVFFSALGGTVNLFLERFGAPALLKAIVFGVLELSGGVSAAAALPATITSALLCAFAAGWSGISVHCQLLSVCSGHGLRFRPYLLAKLAQGFLCILLFWLFLRIYPSAMIPAVLCKG
jgi:hypothetical protein